ncbi:MAG TPA: DMT family transporter [Gemmatimonadaceae bacterium]|nr:DMT family transporter [Gemmatimonadaceae bacterium]
MNAPRIPAVRDPGETGVGTVYTLLAACGFAAVSTLTSIATGAGIALMVVLMWRYVIGAVVMVTYVSTQNFPRMPWRETVRFIVLGGGGQALLVGLALSSLQYIGVATLAFLFYTYPAWVTLVQTIRGAERLTVRRVIALALSFGGIVVIVGAPFGGGAAAALPTAGIALALGAAVVYGMYIPLMQWMQKSHPVSVTSAYAKIGSAFCFLMLALKDGTLTANMPATAWIAIVALALFSTVLPSVFFLMGLMRLGPVRTAIVSTVEPFLTAVLGAIVLRQAVTANALLGGAMIVAAVVVLQFKRERVA